MAADLVRRRVAVIVATGGTHATIAAKNATATIPVLFVTGGDPVRLGLVASLARPGGNMTGVSFLNADLTAKALGLLSQIAPNARTVALLFNPQVPDSARQPADAREAARALGRELLVLNASTDAEIDAAFATLLQRGAGALVMGGDPFFRSRLDRLTALTQRHRIPASYVAREFPAAGGLMSYGTSVADAYRQVGVYVTRILKGDRPADLPVMLSTKFEFVINLKTAKALGLDLPAGVSSMADEIIE
jgi:putative ABC transport system substrate-binding protein